MYEPNLRVGQLVDVRIPRQRVTLVNCEIIEVEHSERDSDQIKVKWSHHRDLVDDSLEFWVPAFHVRCRPFVLFGGRPLVIMDQEDRRSAA